MINAEHKSSAVDEHLIQAALLKAGAQVHKVVGLIAMYRAAIEDSPEAAAQFEQALRRFVATGKLN